MADCEVIERFRLSRARIEWLVEELKEELERNTARSFPLAPETQVNIIVVLFIYMVCMEALCNGDVVQNQQTAGKKLMDRLTLCHANAVHWPLVMTLKGILCMNIKN